jgi:hypothetical protein
MKFGNCICVLQTFVDTQPPGEIFIYYNKYRVEVSMSRKVDNRP